MNRHRVIQTAWHGVNLLFFASIIFLIYSIGWEFSTRKYLQGFSDAIVPASAAPEKKIQAILQWMQGGPARRLEANGSTWPQRDPEETLNYQALLQVCGTATNAFVNIANSSGLPARRLLLLDDRQVVNHVVAEVSVGGRWIVVDPAFRFIPRGPHGEALTRQDLSNPTVFHEAVRGIPNYKSDYDYDMAVRIRLRRIPFVGSFLRAALNRVVPTWEDSVYVTLLAERESFAALILACFSLVFFFVLRILLRWYSEKSLGVHQVHIREQLLRAARVFMGGTS
jgi:transglutaminase superfamily protein